MPLPIIIDDTQIKFEVGTFIWKDYRVEFLRELEDFIVRHYRNHNIVFEDDDGNNINHPEFSAWLKRLCQALNIPPDKIIFKTQIQPLDPYQWIPRRDLYSIANVDFATLNQDRSNAKFVGCLAASRPSMARTRMIYELGTAFGDDAFLTFKPDLAIDRLKWANPDIFAKEIEWFKNRNFDNDQSPDIVILDMHSASYGYWNIWNRFHIEVVCETDEYMNNRLTDKTAKTISGGKPFLLLSGQHSLQNLKNLGFVTFGDFIDESYDQCILPIQRIQAMVGSLLELYKSPNREKLISKMYKHARQNIEIYKQVTPWTDENAWHGPRKQTWGHFPIIPR